MLLPSGGPKGFGLSFLIDLLCGLLSGGASGAAVQPLYGDAAVPYDCSHLFIAIDIAHFGDPAAIRAAAAAAAARVRSGRRAPGVAQCSRRVSRNGGGIKNAAGQVHLAPSVADMLMRMARDLRVSAMPLARDDEQSTRKADMSKREVTSDLIRKPSGVFSRPRGGGGGRLVFISGMTARRRWNDCRHRRHHGADQAGLREHQGSGGGRRRHARPRLPRRRLCAQHGALPGHPRRAQAVFQAALPASTMVEIVKMTSPDYLIEINAIAVIRSDALG